MLQTANSEQITSYTTTDKIARQCEYIIYAYDLFENDKVGCNRWQRVTSGSDIDTMIEKADILYGSGAYQRVEIKKKSYNTKKQTYQVATFKTFGNRRRYNLMSLLTMLILSLSSVGLFYLNFM